MKPEMLIPWQASFNRHTTLLVCLTTLSHRRFVDDAIQVVGLPSGARVRLRYRTKYVATSLLSKAKQLDELGDVRVLVMLAGTSQETSVVRPLRVATVVNMQVAGELLLLDISLGAYVWEATPPNTIWNEIGLIADDLPERFDYVAEGHGTFVQPLQAWPGSVLIGEGVDVWERVAAGFFEVAKLRSQGFRQVPYLYMLEGLTRSTRGWLTQHGAVWLESGRQVSWNVHTMANPSAGIMHNPIGEVHFDVDHSAAKLITSRRVRIDSKRDAKRITLAADSLFRPTHGHLSVRVVVFDYPSDQPGEPSLWKAAEDRKEIVVSRADIPLRVGVFLPAMAALAAAIAAAFAMFDEGITELLNGDVWIPIATAALVFLSLHLGFSNNDG